MWFLIQIFIINLCEIIFRPLSDIFIEKLRQFRKITTELLYKNVYHIMDRHIYVYACTYVCTRHVHLYENCRNTIKFSRDIDRNSDVEAPA